MAKLNSSLLSVTTHYFKTLRIMPLNIMTQMPNDTKHNDTQHDETQHN